MKKNCLFSILVVAGLILVMIVLPFMMACAKPTPAPAPAPTPAPAPAPTPAPAPKPKPEPIVLDMVVWTGEARWERNGIYWFQERVEQGSNGELTINILGSTEVIPKKEQFAALREGVVDLAGLVSDHFGLVPQGYAVNLTGLAEDGTLKKGVREFLNEAYVPYNARFLAHLKMVDSSHIWLREGHKVNSLAELANKKLIGTAKAHLDFIKAIGAVPVVAQVAEWYTAVERGLGDGIVTRTDIHTIGVHEVVKYGIVPAYKTNNNRALYINLETWNKLPKHLQDVLDDVGLSLESDGFIRDQKLAEDDWEIIKAAGVEVLDFTNDPMVEDFTRFYDEKTWESLKGKLSPEDYNKMREFAGF